MTAIHSTITDNANNAVTFEYDSGYVLEVPQTLALQIPSTGGAAIADGEVFTISDGLITETFEFDSNGATGNDTTPAPARPIIEISFTANDTANDIANKIVAAIRSSSLTLFPVNVLNAGGPRFISEAARFIAEHDQHHVGSDGCGGRY